MRKEVEIGFRGRVRALSPDHARMTLLDWLRLAEARTGTKEGCAEGDCGACTVVLVRRGADGARRTEAVNACILLAGQCDGAEVVTVEDLGSPVDTLHPVQEAMIRRHGSQCGFCTPGIVMSLYALQVAGPRPASRADVCDALAGNLCRCTGYRPIIDAALDACAMPPAAVEEAAVPPAGDGDLFSGDGSQFFAAPSSEESLQRLLSAHPDALLIAGGTDAGLTLTKALAEPNKIIWLGRIGCLRQIVRHGDRLTIGATATHAEATPHLAVVHADLGEIMRRFGSVQVRNSGTVGGNIANASPIGDLAPCLIALGATLELASLRGHRRLPLEDFFIAYKKQDRAADEYVRSVDLSLPATDIAFRAFKVSKRLDEDISAVLGAFALQLDGRRILSARLAFGGMAATPVRARLAEIALAGASLDRPAGWRPALEALAAELVPIDDHRASAGYRRLVAGNLLRKALIEIAGTPADTTRIAPPREAARAAG